MFDYEDNRCFPPRLHGIILSTFHPQIGPSIAYEVPEKSTTSANPLYFAFDQVSELLIPKERLCNKLVAFTANDYRIIGYPVIVHDESYERNALIFNCAVILDKSAEYSGYVCVVRKLAHTFKLLEESTKCISKPCKDLNYIRNILENLYEDLNMSCESSIHITDELELNLKLFPSFFVPQHDSIKLWEVPVCAIALKQLVDDSWDLAIQSVIPFINCVNSVQQIINLTQSSEKTVITCLEQLLLYGAITFVDIFQFRNVYHTTPDFSRFVQDEDAQKECIRFVLRKSRPFEVLTCADVVELYASIQTSHTLRDWVLARSEQLKDIDIRRFICFGVIKGFIYRIYRYPILFSGSHDPSKDVVHEIPVHLLDGTHHTDEICTLLNKPIEYIEQCLEKVSGILYIQK